MYVNLFCVGRITHVNKPYKCMLKNDKYVLLDVLNDENNTIDDILKFMSKLNIDIVRVDFFMDIEKSLYFEHNCAWYNRVCDYIDMCNDTYDVFDMDLSTYCINDDFVHLQIAVYTD